MNSSILNKIHLGDSLELLKEVPDASVDVVATDPPYGVGMTHNGTHITFADMAMLKPFFTEFCREMRRVLTPRGEFFIATDWRTYAFLYPILELNLHPRNCIVWNKKTGR